jgi:hypothetical protein
LQDRWFPTNLQASEDLQHRQVMPMVTRRSSNSELGFN